MYDLTTWTTNNCNTHIDQYLKKVRQSGNDIFQLIEGNMKNIFLKNYIQNAMEIFFPDSFLKN